ncbi:hypothetical protein LQG66_33020 [Bradyrhizobium ontarionense]|uniref:Uncharacterized protein n=1 Tax=Bradyrhizobium ontarionense TaxID=2898149 RepID=A0ABY3R9T3_9BRAD|nr:hypothetical protein [Bradyrhizobium sp. A19]UFZ03964.1 hypothetical protein LQG66_33020 [Bradyrhizobium sp. A19]
MTPRTCTDSPILMRATAARWLGMIALAVALSLPLGTGSVRAAPSAAAANAAGTTHVYLLRGVLNIFSLGLDDIAAKLESQGIPNTVANFVSWSSLADEAAAAYRAGRIKTIILVGHSSGATALPDMINKLGQLGVPVKLAIGLDSVFKTKLVGGNAERYINFYIASGAGEPVRRDDGFRGKLENVDVQAVPGVGHVTIEKNQIMQQKVIGAIDAVVFGGKGRPAAPPTSVAGSQRAASVSGYR